MESVIAEYGDLSAAERAVRSLEQHGMSIQNFSITDESRRVWRSSNPPWAHRSRGQIARRGFLFGAALAFVAAQLVLRLWFDEDTRALPPVLTWALVCGTCVLGGCLGGVFSFTRRAPGPRSRPGFYVILRSDAASIDAARTHLATREGA